MPSNEQVIINLRTLLAADILNPENPSLSDSGRLLIRSTKQLITGLIELFQHKNCEDQIQDFLWYLSKARISVDTDDIALRATRAKKKADTAAGKLVARPHEHMPKPYPTPWGISQAYLNVIPELTRIF